MHTDPLTHLPRAAQIVDGHGPETLARIHDEGTAAAVWHKPLPTELTVWLDGLAAKQLPRLRARLPATELAAAVDEACAEAGLQTSSQREALAASLAALARRFSEVMRTSTLEARLDVIATDACRRFHVDRVTARLLCTLRGHGTQLGLSDVTGSVTGIAQAETGDVVMLRGTLWPGEQTALLHRSPPIEGTGETRLLFVLDIPGTEDVEQGGNPFTLAQHA